MRNLAAALIALSAFACSNRENIGIPDPSTACPAQTAMIAVYDSIFETLCGCAEPSPVYSPAGTPLVCTITTGTQVIFHFFATTLKHQITSVGLPAFPSSPLSDPVDAEAMIRVHTVLFSNPGTYVFHDAMNSSLSGTLTVL